MAGKEQAETDDDDGRDGEDIGAAHRILDVTEQAARIGDELRQVVSPARAEQIDAEGGKPDVVLLATPPGFRPQQQHRPSGLKPVSTQNRDVPVGARNRRASSAGPSSWRRSR